MKMASSSGKVFGDGLWKTIAITMLILYMIHLFLFGYPAWPTSKIYSHSNLTSAVNQDHVIDSPTNISHIVFGVVGSHKAWRHRKDYIQSWWRPNITRGYVYLDKAPTEDLLPWPSSCPPYRVSDDITKLLNDSNPLSLVMARLYHAILELYREVREGVRWYVLGDDDSIFFVDNIVDVLSKYDHTKYYYIGGNSESVMSNHWFSFDMGFGGAGILLSYPLAEAMAMSVEECIKRYPRSYTADLMLMTCVADFGVSLTAHKGLHQIDMHGDISGLLSAHPQVPLLSLHHFDIVRPIFPNISRLHSGYKLMRAANIDQSRMLQQTICYHKPSNWSLSISWGYSAQLYEATIPRSSLRKPLETFRPWSANCKGPNYILNIRKWPLKDPCLDPHFFFLDSIKRAPSNNIITNYIRPWPRGLPVCSESGNYSADSISKIQVFSPATKLVESGRSECCDIMLVEGSNTIQAKFRTCTKDDILV